MKNPTKHEYMRRILLAQSRGLFKPGGALYDTRIEHDPSCSLHHGGYCDCNPGIYVTRVDQVGGSTEMEIDAGGRLKVRGGGVN